MRVFEAISAYFMRELVERVYPFLMFLFFTLSLMRSVPMEWALQKIKSLLLRVLAIIFLIGLYQDVKAQQLQSSWFSGDTNSLQIPVFGHLKGEPVAPGSMAWHSAWTDSTGDLYVFGGVSFSGSGLNPNNRLFKYSQGTWRWLGGDSLNAAFNPSVGGFSGGEPTFGTQGVASPSNQPGARYLATYWQGPNHEFYLYGGIGMGAGGQFGLLSDLWVYQNGMWTWLSGSSSVNSMPVHGTQNQEASNNNPGSRIGAMAWSDDQGDSYVFGGQSLFGNQSDVMKWDGSNWTWIAGPSTANQPGSIALNQPAARRFAAICKTPDGDVYLHGGEQGGNSSRFGDLWTWNGSGWDHLDGAISPLASISYSNSQSPGDRSDHQMFYVDSTLYLFGGLHSINGGNSLESRADFWSWKSDSWSLLRASSPNDVGSYGQLMQSSSNVFPASISNGTAVNVGDGVYFFGGRRNGTSNFVDDLFYFDGHQFQYLYGSDGLADMPEIYDLGAKAVRPGSIEKAAFNFDVSSGHLFIFGGKQYYRDGSTALSNTLWSYDGLNWIWEKGDSLASSLPTYGAQGVAAVANNPGAREEAVLWEDGNGLLWLFGGFGLDEDGDYGYLNDLWSYDYTNWTWVSGSKQANDLGSYGAKGQSSPNIYPGGRRSMEVWVDANGLAYIYGGYGLDRLNAEGALNEFWTWDGNSWTWLGGDTLINSKGDYGVKGLTNASNYPGARSNFMMARSDTGFYIYGGEGVNAQNAIGNLNELWHFDGQYWTYLFGSEDQVNLLPSYGVATDNEPQVNPGNLIGGSAWLSPEGLFIFGGETLNSQSALATTNNLWHWDGQSWAWLKGSQNQSLGDQKANYNTLFEEGFEFHPPALKESVYWTDGSNHYLFGGSGVGQNLALNQSFNTLWKFGLGNHLKNGVWSNSSAISGQHSAQVFESSALNTDFKTGDLLIDANFSFSGDGTIELGGDLFNYGDNAWQGDWEISNATQSQIFGDTLEVYGVLLVDEEASLKTNGLLRIKASDGSSFGQLLNFGDVIGELDFEYYLDLGSDSVDNGRYFYLGLVLDSVEIGDLNQGGLLNSGQANSSLNTVWQWNGSTASWESPAIHSTVSAGSGLAIYAGNRNSHNFLFPNGKSAVLRIRGYARNNASLSRVLNYNDGQSSTASFVGGTHKSATEGWNLLANPFSHNVDVEQILSGFRRKSIYVWDGSNYRSFVNGVSVNGGSSLLAPGQAFYYQTVDQLQRTGPNDFTFQRARADVGRSANFFKNLDSEQDYFRVKLSANSDTNFSDEVLVRFSSLTDTAYNGGYEAWGIRDHSILADIAVSKPDGLRSIALWNSDSLIWIPLKVDAKNGEELKFSFDLEHLGSRATIYLHDLLLDRVMEVGYGFEYSFKHDSLLTDSRFYLSESSKSLGENGFGSTDVFWFSDENGVHLDFGKVRSDDVKEFKIYDTAGQLVFSKNGLQQKEVLVLANEPSGIYFVYCKGSGFQQVIKVMRR